ncbi:two-component sensor histidine kinase [Clostridium gelidum]|uniref:histidine kinase n=1 Tax=Clostridium gelidum TaxID=704125 RepID=A0ABN6IWS4_9CLOT|nr:HAMP domain-containing sensor histidine kinase [Clostridium gelidum]BCZ46599.1 two-component sensor histidine kinase [Clostridium gelidum]
MQNLITIILSILLCINFTLLILRRNEIKLITKKLKIINNNDTNELLRISYPNSNIEDLLLEINYTLKLNKEIQCKSKEMDLELRQAIANISHDLRTPLTSIMGYIQLLNDKSISKDEHAEYLLIIEKRSSALKDLISSFYDLSRLQANEYTIDIEKINLQSILCELIATYYEDFNNKNLEPEINIDENAPLIYGDKNAVIRIFTNLIQNILKHAEGNLEISLKLEGKYIITEFSNKAVELSEEDAKKVFERFFTADRMRSGQNTGLGLAITKILVEKQGHEIEAVKRNDNLIIRIKWKI